MKLLARLRAARSAATPSQDDAGACVYAFGSSSTEVLDYIFGPSPRYKSLWASGWSARGLRKEDNRAYVLNCLKEARPQDIILLHYGVADALFNSAYRMDKGDFLDPEGFCQEAADGVATLVRDLKAAGFANVYTLSLTVPVPLPPRYFKRKFGFHGLPVLYQAQLLNRVAELIAQRTRSLNLMPLLSNEKGLLKAEFRREVNNHHADYTRIQALVWEALQVIPGLPPRRETWLQVLYDSDKRGGVTKRIREEQYAPVDLAPFEAAGAEAQTGKRAAGKGPDAGARRARPQAA